MNLFAKTFTKRSLLVALIVLLLSGVSPAAGPEIDSEGEDVTGLAGGMDQLVISPHYTVNVVSVTEGILNLPLPRQLNNFIPFDGDFTVIVAAGFTGDKLSIKVSDNPGFGDRLMAFALGFYLNYGVYPFFGSVYSNDTSGNSFVMDIPVFAPGITVWLFTGYQRPSVGENPYNYQITLSFPK